MKIRSAVPENGCLIVLVDGKKTKNKKTIAKHICICLLPEGGCVNETTMDKQMHDKLPTTLQTLSDRSK